MSQVCFDSISAFSHSVIHFIRSMHAFVCSPIHQFTHSFIRPCIRSCWNSFHSSTHLFFMHVIIKCTRSFHSNDSHWNHSESDRLCPPSRIHTRQNKPTVVSQENHFKFTQCLITRPWYLTPDTWVLVPDTWNLLHDQVTWYLITNTWYLTPDT